MIENIFEELVVVKRSGQRVNFNGTKIAVAIKSAFDDVDLDSLPQNSSLEKNVVAHYKAGKYVHETGGVIPF